MAREEAKAVDDARFMTTFIPDSSEASRVRATLIQEQKKALPWKNHREAIAEAVEKHLAEEQDNAPEAAMLNQITAVAREDKVCIHLTADDDADAEEDRNTSSSNNALLRTMLDPAMQMRIYIDPPSVRRVTLLSEPAPTPLSTRDTPGVQIVHGVMMHKLC